MCVNTHVYVCVSLSLHPVVMYNTTGATTNTLQINIETTIIKYSR